MSTTNYSYEISAMDRLAASSNIACSTGCGQVTRSVSLVFFAGFTIVTSLHFLRMVERRAWFCIPLVINGILEIIVYGLRALSAVTTIPPVLVAVQSLSISIAPSLLAISIHLALAEVTKSTKGGHFQAMRMNTLTNLLAVGYLISISYQCQGASFNIHTPGGNDTSKIFDVGNLLLQIGLLGVSAVAASDLQGRMRNSSDLSSSKFLTIWKNDLVMLYCVGTLVLLRTLFRLLEQFVMLEHLPFLHEWASFIFDGDMMLAALVFFYCYHPASTQIVTQARDVDNNTAHDTDMKQSNRSDA
ncbi:hypothetical protein E4T44_00136 [Aureobasidium sp. EXF-8845]|nr:hypothetical protein E4T44_00136 [Aureobasidium sp. EXF-8845]